MRPEQIPRCSSRSKTSRTAPHLTSRLYTKGGAMRVIYEQKAQHRRLDFTCACLEQFLHRWMIFCHDRRPVTNSEHRFFDVVHFQIACLGKQAVRCRRRHAAVRTARVPCVLGERGRIVLTPLYSLIPVLSYEIFIYKFSFIYKRSSLPLEISQSLSLSRSLVIATRPLISISLAPPAERISRSP